MSFGSRIRERREELGLKQSELGKMLGVTGSAVGNYENGVSSPKAELLYPLMAALKCDANYLYQDEMDALGGSPMNLLYEETNHIKKYRLLDPYGKEAVDSVLDIEYRRCTELAQSAPEPQRMVEKLIYINPAAAGAPLYAESDFKRMEFLEDKVPHGADFGIRISGRSMEPTVMDGAIAWVHKTIELADGDVGVFMLNDSAVCKRYYKNDDGSVRLESDNPKFDPAIVTEFDTFVPVGKVVGTV